LHYISELKYDTPGRVAVTGVTDELNLNLRTSSFTQRLVGSYDPEKNVTPITVRTFIERASFDNLAGWTTFKNSKRLDELEQREPRVHACFARWINKSQDTIIPETTKVTVTKLGCYQSPGAAKKIVINSLERVLCVVGDAFLGVPFFRSMNNGLKCGSKLADSIVKQLYLIDHPDEPSCKHLFTLFRNDDPMQSYEAFAKNVAWWEILAARIKSFFINYYIHLVRADLSVVRIVGRLLFSHLTPAEYLEEARVKLKFPLIAGQFVS
jgi:hypothetical protein